MKIKVYLKTIEDIKTHKKRFGCICLASNKRCNNERCKIDIVEYDQYRNWQQCFKNRDEDKYK